MASLEALAHQRRRDPMSAADLKHSVIWRDIHLLHNQSQPLTHRRFPHSPMSLAKAYRVQAGTAAGCKTSYIFLALH
jgi:hypothetical protein